VAGEALQVHLARSAVTLFAMETVVNIEWRNGFFGDGRCDVLSAIITATYSLKRWEEGSK
jgi:hypothetical protein